MNVVFLGWILLAMAAANAQRLPPIPKASPPARPKSDHQIGLPIALTRAAIPANNPQTPEKMVLGEKLFFYGRLSADGTVACSSRHDPALASASPTGIHSATQARRRQISFQPTANSVFKVLCHFRGGQPHHYSKQLDINTTSTPVLCRALNPCLCLG
jgi:cytochrome c peroxidase